SVLYDVSFGTSPQAMTPVGTTAATTWAASSLAFGTTYYWTVRARDGYGAATSLAGGAVQSLARVFENQPPTAPSIIAGNGRLATRATTQSLAWAAATDPDGDAVTYDLALSTDPATKGIIWSSTATAYPLNFQFGTTYYWQVTAKDAFGGATASPFQSFT